MTKKELDRRRFLTLAPAAVAMVPLAGAMSALGATTTDGEAKEICYRRALPIGRAYDVVVCGAGPSGAATALAARRADLDVLLVEGQGQLGGTGTSGLVSHWLRGRSNDCTQWVVGACFVRFARRRHGAARRWSRSLIRY